MNLYLSCPGLECKRKVRLKVKREDMVGIPEGVITEEQLQWLRDQLKHHMASKQDSNPCLQGSYEDIEQAILQVQPTAWTFEGTQAPVQQVIPEEQLQQEPQQEPQQVAVPKRRPIARAAGRSRSMRRAPAPITPPLLQQQQHQQQQAVAVADSRLNPQLLQPPPVTEELLLLREILRELRDFAAAYRSSSAHHRDSLRVSHRHHERRHG